MTMNANELKILKQIHDRIERLSSTEALAFVRKCANDREAAVRGDVN